MMAKKKAKKKKKFTAKQKAQRTKLRGRTRERALAILIDLHAETGEPVTAFEVFAKLPESTRKLYDQDNGSLVGQIFRGMTKSGLVIKAEHRKGSRQTSYLPAENVAKRKGTRRKLVKATAKALIASLDVPMSPLSLDALAKLSASNGVTPSALASVFIQDRLTELARTS